MELMPTDDEVQIGATRSGRVIFMIGNSSAVLPVADAKKALAILADSIRHAEETLAEKNNAVGL